MKRLLLTAAVICCAASAQDAATHHIVPGAQRLLDAGAEAQAGAVLIDFLRCGSCHELPEPLTAVIPPPHQRRVPLTGRGKVDVNHLRDYILDPQHAKPGATMPRVLKEGDERTALELAHYILSLESTAAPDGQYEGEAERGADLYHTVGCVSCHSPHRDPKPAFTDPDDPFADETEIEYPPLAVNSVPIGAVGKSWTQAGLAAYLLHGTGRMPDMKLDEQEAADIATYLLAREDSAPSEFEFDPALAKAGAVHYDRLGCVQCHNGGEPIQTTPVQIESESGCMMPGANHSGPSYTLSEAQASAIQEAWGTTTFDAKAGAFLHFTAVKNCLACHKRGEFGGVDPGRAPYFVTTTDKDLGDEGSIPPTLTGVGSKLTVEALEAVIAGQATARPYMATRMPNFHFKNPTEVAANLAEIDEDPDAPATDVTGLLHHHRNHYGRELMGDQAFNCVSCHNLNGHPSTGIPAIDLALAPTRLRPEWFKKYLLDPAALRPGTRMPAYFPEGKSTYAKLWGGDAEKQIEAIWIYLREVDQTRLPTGMEKDDRYVIVPEDRPVVHRTFMKDVGSRAIAIGFPEGIHFAFDATRVRMVMAWAGGFIDADATWNDRFSPYIEPLSGDHWTFPPVMPFAFGEDFDTPWLEAEGTDADYHFEGIRLDDKRVPTLLYRIGDIQVEETLTPLNDRNGFRRTFSLMNVSSPIRYLVAVGAHVDEEADGGYHVNSAWETHIEAPGAELRQVLAPNGLAALVAKWEASDEPIEFSQEIVW